MLKAKLSDGRIFGITFAHPTLQTEIGAHILKVRVTRCDLFEIFTGPLARERPIASEIAKCSPRDNFEKERGRKIALTRAIEAAKLPKKDRSILWEAYLYRDASPKDPTPPVSPTPAVVSDRIVAAPLEAYTPSQGLRLIHSRRDEVVGLGDVSPFVPHVHDRRFQRMRVGSTIH